MLPVPIRPFDSDTDSDTDSELPGLVPLRLTALPMSFEARERSDYPTLSS